MQSFCKLFDLVNKYMNLFCFLFWWMFSWLSIICHSLIKEMNAMLKWASLWESCFHSNCYHAISLDNATTRRSIIYADVCNSHVVNHLKLVFFWGGWTTLLKGHIKGLAFQTVKESQRLCVFVFLQGYFVAKSSLLKYFFPHHMRFDQFHILMTSTNVF